MQIEGFAKRGNIEGVRHLLDNVPTASRDSWLNTLLIAAAGSPYAGLEMLKFLLESGADPNSNTEFVSLLGLAAKSVQIEKVRFLVDHGADVNKARQHGYTALIDAVHNLNQAQQLPVIEFLLQIGANPDVESDAGESPLSVSAHFGHFEVVKMLLEAGADPSSLQWTQLMRAIVLGDLNAVETELQKTLDLTTENRWGRNAWRLALVVGDIDKAKLLLQYGAESDSADLLEAVLNDNPEITQWLLDMGADPDVFDEFNFRTPLINAAIYGSAECVRVLIEAGADVQATNTVSSQAIDEAQNIEIVKLLISAGADIDYVNGEGYTLLRSVAEQENVQMVKDLLVLGADPNATRLGETPLYTAVGLDNLEIVRILLDAGADPNIQTLADGWFPLQRVRSLEVAHALINAGADVNMKDYMVDKGALQSIQEPIVVEVLIEAGAKVNPDNTTYGTPLIHAAQSRNLPLMQLFLKRGAEINATTSWGLTAIMEAAEQRFVEGVTLLLESGADLHLQDEDGRTALHRAAAPEAFTAYEISPRKVTSLDVEYSVTVIHILVKAGVALDEQDAEGRTALMLGSMYGHPEIVRKLISLGADKALRDKNGRSADNLVQEHSQEEFRQQIRQILRIAQ